MRHLGDAGEMARLATVTTRILSNVDRADQMIQDLLDANLIQAGGKLPIEIIPSDLQTIASVAMETLMIQSR